MRFESRLKALERIRKDLEGKHLRVITHGSASFQVNLANSSCKRTLGADGILMEMVELGGNVESMTDAELDAFVESFPIEECKPKATDIRQ
jgi:hypothetical protein